MTKSAGNWRPMLLLVGGVLCLGFLAGMSAEFLAEPSKAIRRLAMKVAPEEETAPVVNPDVESIFLHFSQKAIQVPFTRHGRGGGLTVVDNAAVLSTVDGKLYMASSPETLKPLSIGVPDYGFDDFIAYAEDPKHGEYRFERWAYRYFDLIAFDFDGGKHLALSYIKFEPERECFHTIVATLGIPSSAADLAVFTATPEDWKTVFVTEPCLPLKKIQSAIEVQIGGGRMAYDGNGKLYLGSGDFHIDGVFSEMPAIAQNPAYDYGKVIEMDLASGRNRQVAQGLRNMQGVAFDADGQLWTVEHGLRGGDELNLIREGKDYGWPGESLGTLYNQLPIPNTLSYGRHDTFEPPIFAFLPSVAISSLELLQGFNPAWDGDILMGTLKDQSPYRFRIVEDRVMFAERIPIGKRIRAARQLDADRLVLFTDDNELVFLTEKPNGQAMSFLRAYLGQETLGAHVRARLESNINTCLKCHSLDPEVNEFAPSLATIVGAKIGKRQFANYSDWMREQQAAWTPETLAGFLKDPAAAAPGTTMPDPGIHDPEEIGQIIGFLAAMGSPLEFTPDQVTQ